MARVYVNFNNASSISNIRFVDANGNYLGSAINNSSSNYVDSSVDLYFDSIQGSTSGYTYYWGSSSGAKTYQIVGDGGGEEVTIYNRTIYITEVSSAPTTCRIRVNFDNAPDVSNIRFVYNNGSYAGSAINNSTSNYVDVTADIYFDTVNLKSGVTGDYTYYWSSSPNFPTNSTWMIGDGEEVTKGNRTIYFKAVKEEYTVNVSTNYTALNDGSYAWADPSKASNGETIRLVSVTAATKDAYKYTFDGWYYEDNSSGIERLLSSSSSVNTTFYNYRKYKAHFTRTNRYQITAMVDPEGAGSISGKISTTTSGSVWLDEGDTFTLTASDAAARGYEWNGWYSHGLLYSNNKSITPTVTSTAVYVATYKEKPSYLVTLTVASGSGTIRVNGTDFTTSTGAYKFYEGETLTVYAYPSDTTTYSFLRWTTGDLDRQYSTSRTISLTTSNANQVFRAWFKAKEGLFNWTDNDDIYIASGQLTSNIKATKWLEFLATIQRLNPDFYYSTDGIVKDGIITDTIFNHAVDGLNSLSGVGSTVPNKVSDRGICYASLFHGGKSLKAAINAAINAFNSN